MRTIRRMVRFYSEELLAPRPNPKLQVGLLRIYGF